jgi:hypothetical protein
MLICASTETAKFQVYFELQTLFVYTTLLVVQVCIVWEAHSILAARTYPRFTVILGILKIWVAS